MELRKIEKPDYREIKAIYTGAFPPDERAPFRLLRKRAEQGMADFWIISEEGKSIGLAYLVTYKDLAYLFYYAIDPSYRGQGYGTKDDPEPEGTPFEFTSDSHYASNEGSGECGSGTDDRGERVCPDRHARKSDEGV